MKRQKLPPIPYEATEDKDFCLWARKLELFVPELEAMYHIPNETAWRLGMDQGIRAGVSDWHIPVPARGYIGLFIEMKRQKGGKTSPQQLQWLERMRFYGHFGIVCKGAESAKKLVIWYFDISPHVLSLCEPLS
jgi:VRR-NUC domain